MRLPLHKRLAFAALAGLVLTTAGLGVAEIAVRWLRPSALPVEGLFLPDPDAGFVMRAGWPPSTIRTDEYVYTVRTNATGQRDERDYGSKEPGILRILGLGDSFTFGQGVPIEQTYLARLEQALGPTVEVVKAGVQGYNTAHEVGFFRSRGRRFEPDIVLLGFLPNDLTCLALGTGQFELAEGTLQRDRCFGGDGERREGEGRPARAELLLAEWSHIFRLFAHRRLAGWTLRHPRPDESFYLGMYRKAEPEATAESWRAMGLLLDELGSGVERAHARLAIVAIPQREQVMVPAPPDIEWRLPMRRLGAEAERRGIPFLDLLPAFRAHPGPGPLHFARDGHATAAGHALMATEIAAFLRAEGLVPGGSRRVDPPAEW